MSTNAFLGGMTFALLDSTVSPNVYNTIEEVTEIPSFGETAPLVQVTHFQSTSHEYIAGLADGDEFSIPCNRTHISPSQQDKLIAGKGATVTLRLTHTRTNVSPNQTKIYDFDAVSMGYSITASVDDKSTISFNFKISGGVTLT